MSPYDAVDQVVDTLVGLQAVILPRIIVVRCRKAKLTVEAMPDDLEPAAKPNSVSRLPFDVVRLLGPGHAYFLTVLDPSGSGD